MVCTVGCGGDQWFMVSKDLLIIQVEIIIADFGIFFVFLMRIIFTESIVKSGIQMVISTVDPDDIPCMAIFDALIRVITADGNDAPDTQGIQKNFNCLGDSLADSYALSSRTDDLVGVGFF